MTRIKEIINVSRSYEKRVSVFYDLFCDHGKIGASLLDTKKRIIFNDKQDHLMQDLENRFDGQSEFIRGDAGDIQFEPNSFIICAGVGGHLLVECFNRWFSTHEYHLMESLIFLMCPTYYENNLRHYLREKKFKTLDEWICLEKGRTYDMQVVSLNAEGPVVGFISYPKNKANYQEYLQRQLLNLEKKRHPTAQDRELISLYKAQKLS